MPVGPMAECRPVRSLFLTTMLPSGKGSGGEIVTAGIVEALTAAGHDVRTLGYRRPGEHRHGGPGERCVGERPIETAGAGARALGWMAAAIARREPYTTAKYRSRTLSVTTASELAAGPAMVFVDHAKLGFLVRGGTGPAPLVFIAHNAEGASYRQLAADADQHVVRRLHAREARLIEVAELELAGRAAQVWTLSADDAAMFMARVPGADVRVLEVGSGVAPAAAASECDIGLIGSWSWRPNALGLEWFCREIVPRLPGALRIEVAGRGAEWLRGRYPNVVVVGTVTDAPAFLASARAIAVPAVAGTGIQIKTLDAIASGRPVVVTPVGARGLGDLPPAVSVCEEPERFAAELVKRAGERAPEPDPGLLEWSRRRRERFEAAVAAWSAELAAPVPARPESPPRVLN